MRRVWEGQETIVLFGMPFHPLLFIRMPEYVGHLANTFCFLLTAHIGSDWKEHKQSCKRFSASNTITVKPNYGATFSLAQFPCSILRAQFQDFPLPFQRWARIGPRNR